MSQFQDFDHGITAIDSGYLRPRYDAIHLIDEGGRCAIVDVGTNYSVPHVLGTLAAKNLQPDCVDYIFLTHVHLDHAGGAGELASKLPNAMVVVHPRGARHMIDPSKLIAGAIGVYGEETVQKDYGTIRPIPAERVIEAADNCEIRLNGRPFHFLDTAGHARHHNCIYDEKANAVFTGDSFGLSWREFDVDGREFILPTTSPVQFELEPAHATVERLLSHKPAAAYLTHYSRVTDLRRLGDDLHILLDEFAELARGLKEAGERRHALMIEGIRNILLNRLRQHGCTLSRERCLEVLGNDVELNAQGLEVWADKQG